MGTVVATKATLTNKSMPLHNVYSLEGTIRSDNNADSHPSGGLAWDGFTRHEDAPEKPNSFAENAL